MFRLILSVVAVTLAVSAIPTGLLDPEEVPFLLGEEEFEDYLDEWLAKEERTWVNTTSLEDRSARSGNQLYYL